MKRTPQVNTTLPESPSGVLAALGAALGGPGQVRSRATDRLALGHDASHFALTPSVVATPVDAAEVGRLFAVSAAQGVPLTFRSGGTSLSGQGVTDGILVDTRRHFRDIEILDAGARVRIGPGATVRQVNARLGQLGRKLGPDPASEIACTLGGVVANNSSGMACGTIANTYNTLDSLVLVLPSGTVIDTGANDADQRLLALEPVLYQGLARLRDRVRSNPGLGADRRAAVLDEEHHGLRAELPAGPHPAGGHPGAPGGRQRGHPRLHRIRRHAHRPAAQARDDRSAGVRDPQRGNGFTSRLGRDRTCHHRTARRRIAAGRAGGPASRRKSAANHRGPARRVAGRVPGRLGRRGRRPQRRRAPGAERRYRSPAPRSSPRTPGRGPGCGTPARASTPPSPRQGRRAAPRCWRTSSSRCRPCWTPANS